MLEVLELVLHLVLVSPGSLATYDIDPVTYWRCGENDEILFESYERKVDVLGLDFYNLLVQNSLCN